ncbi:hypothetical protein LSCM1_08066 [Leishmania martiniquensis]|uniref:Transmembrane protein n=1 Tax=Leishmania martiniquensis TaxID=1580590 RepID=A0A836L3X3_9TRYP|nr:hypothetical protein LSCM1_08066 [Leishmania martiniquensis]
MSAAYVAKCAHLCKGGPRSVASVCAHERGCRQVALLRRPPCAQSTIAKQHGTACVSAKLSLRCCCTVTGNHHATDASRGVTPPFESLTASQQPTVEDLFTSRFDTGVYAHCRGTSANAAPPPASRCAAAELPFSERLPSLASRTTAKAHKTGASLAARRAQAVPWGGLWQCLTSRSHLPAISIIHSMGKTPHPASTANDGLPSVPLPPSACFSPQNAPAADEAAGLSSSSLPPPPPAVQRYWHSYRLWASLHPHIQQEHLAVLHLRAQANAAKVAQQESLRQHLYRTMYWTLFVVCPLLGLLFLWLTVEAAAYGAELEVLPFVKYDEALRDFAEAEGHHRQLRSAKGSSGALKKKNVRID